MRQLYSYFRSSASFRVRIALNLKGLEHAIVPVHLLHGEQLQPAFLGVNPAGLVPALAEHGAVLTQSLAIMEYLDETHPEPPLLPGTPLDRARMRALALAIACEIHPLNNLKVLKYLKHALGASDDARNAWYRHWVESGLAALERQLEPGPPGRYCHGERPTLPDCCLVPQIFNARRFDCRLDHVPGVMRIFDQCMQLDAFQRAAPAAQPDAE
ncbi:MAG: maleylacetoacetate isomerase [Rhodocyclaceae bacterium]|nr:maleylacetoacetate isomerase [Rhodocyclaceae bacterium]